MKRKPERKNSTRESSIQDWDCRLDIRL